MDIKKLFKNLSLAEGIEIEEDIIDIEDGIPCVILIEDIGNCFAFVELVEKDTELKSQYDVEVEYQDEELEPTLQYVLAYYKDGEFYDENGENMNLEDIVVDFDESLNENVDIKAALDKAFEDVNEWAYPYADIDLLRIYADFGDATQEEIVKFVKDTNYGEVVEIDNAFIEDLKEEDPDKDYSDYLGMIFISPICPNLYYKVFDAIKAGEF